VAVEQPSIAEHTLNVIIEREADGYFVARVPELHGCHTQARSLDELMVRIREAAKLCLEVLMPRSAVPTSVLMIARSFA